MHLVPHAVERCIERTHCAPSWLADVLAAGQFAHLRHLRYKRRRAVLVFDALQDQHIVAILGATTVRAVTVLTTEQFKNTYGPIPPVLLSLARQARQQALIPAATRPAGPAYPVDADPGDRTACKLAERWRASWHCHIDLCPEHGVSGTMRTRLAAELKQGGLVEAQVARTGVTCAEAVSAIAREAFDVQARLLVESRQFQQWLVGFLSSQGVDLAQLVGLRVEASYHRKKGVDVTQALIRALAAGA